MLNSFRNLVVLILAVGGLCGLCYGMTATVELAYRDGIRADGWETIAVTVADVRGGAAGPMTVTVQDGRGGLGFSRTVDGSTATPSAKNPNQREVRVLLPLPCVGEASLAADAWPLLVTIEAPGEGTKKIPIELKRPATGASRIVRVLEIGGATAGGSIPSPDAAIVRTSMTAGDFAANPPLTLAGFDVVTLSAKDAANIDGPRALALFNAGLQIVVESPAPPDGGLGGIVWSRLPDSDANSPTRWLAPRQPVHRPAVIEPTLASSNARDFLPVPEASPGLIRVLLLTAPVGIGVLLLLRVLIRRQTLMLGAATATMMIWGAIAAALVAGSGSGASRTARWQTYFIGSTGTNVALLETLRSSNSLVARDLHYTLRPDQLMLPIAIYPRQFFSINGTLNLNATAPALTLHAPARSLILLQTRTIEATRDIPPLPALADEIPRWSTLTQLPLDGVWIDGGYVQKNLADTPEGRTPFDRWIRQSAEMERARDSALLWYELRFRGADLYHLRPITTADGTLTLQFLDFGPAPIPAASPATTTAPATTTTPVDLKLTP